MTSFQVFSFLLITASFWTIKVHGLSGPNGIKYHSRASGWVPVLEKLLASGNIRAAAIFGGTGRWASTSEFHSDERDFKIMWRDFSSPNNFFSNGLKIGSNKYEVLNANFDTVEGKLLDNGGGAYVLKTSTDTLLVGEYSTEMDPSSALAAMQEAKTSVEAEEADYRVESSREH